MTSEQIEEKIARSMCTANGRDPDTQVADELNGIDSVLYTPHWRNFLPRAKELIAVLNAMHGAGKLTSQAIPSVASAPTKDRPENPAEWSLQIGRTIADKHCCPDTPDGRGYTQCVLDIARSLEAERAASQSSLGGLILFNEVLGKILYAALMAKNRLDDFADRANASEVSHNPLEWKHRICDAFADFETSRKLLETAQ